MPKPTWRLIVREPGASERRVDVGRPELFVGRHSSSGLCLQDPSVSVRHARLWVDGVSLRIEDLGSRNATLVEGGAELTLGMSASLSGGEVLRLGETRMLVLAAGASAPRTSEWGAGEGSTVRLAGREAGLGEPPGLGAAVKSTAQLRPSEAIGRDPAESVQREVLGRRARLTLCGRSIHAVVDIDRVPFVVGRKPASGIDFVVDHEQISRRHMCIEYSSGRFRVRDMGSANGTRVDGLSVVGDFPAPLGQDAVIDLAYASGAPRSTGFR